MADVEYLTESEVTKENLAQLFKRAFFNTTFDSDGDLVVQTDGPRVLVTIDPERHLVKYMAIYGVTEWSPIEQKLALSNALNDKFIFARFSIPEKRDDVLIADYFLPYEGGIPAFQIISAIRLFSRVVPAAIRVCDDNNLVE
jgi:hypothetical protein